MVELVKSFPWWERVLMAYMLLSIPCMFAVFAWGDFRRWHKAGSKAWEELAMAIFFTAIALLATAWATWRTFLILRGS